MNSKTIRRADTLFKKIPIKHKIIIIITGFKHSFYTRRRTLLSDHLVRKNISNLICILFLSRKDSISLIKTLFDINGHFVSCRCYSPVFSWLFHILKLQNVFTEIRTREWHRGTRGEATFVTTIACLKDINKTKPPEARFRVRHFDHN